MKKTETGKIIILSAPSRGGKDAVASALRKDKSIKLYKVVTYTTRPKRDYEKQGVHYNFVARKKFNQMIRSGKFLEWAKVNKLLYGTPRQQVELMLAKGKNILLIIDTKGARNVIKKMPGQTVSIFLKPPTLADLRLRFSNDPNFPASQIKLRMAKARAEIKASKIYDYRVINAQGKLERTVKDVRKILKNRLDISHGKVYNLKTN